MVTKLLRLKKELLDKITKRAQENDRSVNSEIITAIKDYLK